MGRSVPRHFVDLPGNQDLLLLIPLKFFHCYMADCNDFLLVEIHQLHNALETQYTACATPILSVLTGFLFAI